MSRCISSAHYVVRVARELARRVKLVNPVFGVSRRLLLLQLLPMQATPRCMAKPQLPKVLPICFILLLVRWNIAFHYGRNYEDLPQRLLQNFLPYQVFQMSWLRPVWPSPAQSFHFCILQAAGPTP